MLKKRLAALFLAFAMLVAPVFTPRADAGALDTLQGILDGDLNTITDLARKIDPRTLEKIRDALQGGMDKLNEITDSIKAGGMEFALDHFADKIDDYVNEQAPLKTEDGAATRVVPIVTVGSNSYLGAAQVTGPKEQVEKVAAALTVEGEIARGFVRVQYLVPVDAKDPTKAKRVSGVGISARLDLSLTGSRK